MPALASRNFFTTHTSCRIARTVANAPSPDCAFNASFPIEVPRNAAIAAGCGRSATPVWP
jgi:hypothetical protein